MKRTFVLCAAACLAVAALAIPTSARANDNGAVAAGVIGGLAVGAMIGSAAAANDGPYNQPAPAYYGPGSPGCYCAPAGLGWLLLAQDAHSRVQLIC